MLDYTGSFKEEIKNNYRKVDIEIGFIKNNKNYFLAGKDIQKHTYRAEVKKGLGGTVRKVINMSLMATEITKLLIKGDSFNLFYTVGDKSQCKIDIFFINQIKTNDKNQIIEVEALDYLSYTEDNQMPFIAMEKNTTLLSYVNKLLENISLDLVTKGNIPNPNLKLAYPKSYKLQDTLDEMGGALNSTITTKTNVTFGARLPLIVPFSFTDANISDYVYVEIKPFKALEPVESLDFNNCLLEMSIDDNNEKYERVSISVFNPSSTKSKDLGQVNKQVPAMTKNVDLGIAQFDKSCMPQVIHFDGEVEVVDFNIGIERASFKVNTKDILNDNLSLDFQGLDFNTVSSFEESNSRTKIVNNMYIQSPNIYDSRILLGNSITIKYTGNPLLEVGDTIDVIGNTVLITEHELAYTGGLRGVVKGVIISE